MKEQKVLILEKQGGGWAPFLHDYLSDTSALVDVVSEIAQAGASFDRAAPCVLFVTPEFLSKTLLQKIRVRNHIDPRFRAYFLGSARLVPGESPFKGYWEGSPGAIDLNKGFVETLALPDTIRLLVVDDEEEIGAMVRDYFEGRQAPAFEVEYAAHGLKALDAVSRKRPDVIILDIKMPVMDGREFYARLKREKIEVPVIVFFDSISGEELAAMREIGDPAVIEKGARGSSLAALMALIKKLVYFSGQ